MHLGQAVGEVHDDPGRRHEAERGAELPSRTAEGQAGGGEERADGDEFAGGGHRLVVHQHQRHRDHEELDGDGGHDAAVAEPPVGVVDGVPGGQEHPDVADDLADAAAPATGSLRGVAGRRGAREFGHPRILGTTGR